MSDRAHLPKIEAWTYPATGGWFIATEGDACGPAGSVWILAPTVNGYGRLTLHSIDRNGEVNASVLMRGAKNSQPAEYHEFVILDGWDPATWKIAGEEVIRRDVEGVCAPPV